MRRLITVFALIAALFVLMGCGVGSKESLEQGAPVPSVEPKVNVEAESLPTFTLLSGMYSGKNSGVIYATNAPENIEAELKDARQYEQGRKQLVAKMRDLEKDLSDDSEKTDIKVALIEKELKVNGEALEALDKSREDKKDLEELENFIAYHLDSIRFEITMSEEGKPQVGQLSMKTEEDVEHEEDIQKTDVVLDGTRTYTEHVFGNMIKVELNKATFDPSTGLLSFSFFGTYGEKTHLYALEVKISDQLMKEGEQEFREITFTKGRMLEIPIPISLFISPIL